MKELLKFGFWFFLIIALTGCGTGAREIALKSQGERTDVFREIHEGVPIPKEFVELTITSSIKTHLEGHYLLESKGSLHGKPGYPFVINIDGQAVIWKVEGEEESTPLYVKEEKHLPEGGKGRCYNLDKKVRLSAGSHHVFFGLPGEEYYTESNLILKSGESYTLEYKPFYDQSGPLHHTEFVYGVKKLEVYLNGVPIH